MAKNVVWQNLDLEIDETELEAEDSPSADELYELAAEEAARELEELRIIADLPLESDILVIVDVGRWNGRHPAAVVIPGNLKSCFNPMFLDSGFGEYWIDPNGNLCSSEVHHDNTNFYVYRGIKPETTPAQLNRLTKKIISQTVTMRDLGRLTYKLGPKMKAVLSGDIKPADVEKA